MDVKQVATFVNTAVKEAVGEIPAETEDLSNIVDLGNSVFNANAMDKYVGALVNQVGKFVFVSRVYAGSAPKVLMDAWEFGSVVEKVRMETPEAQENPTWGLEDGKDYDQDTFTAPKIEVKFYNSKLTLEVPISITKRQVKQSFQSAGQMNGFIEMIYTAMDNAMTEKLDALILKVIANAIGETIYSDYADAELSSKSGVKAVNLLKLYNDKYETTLSVAKAFEDKDFLRFASKMIGIYIKRIQKMSRLFNVGKTKKFTPENLLHIDLLTDYVASSVSNLQSDTFHDQLVKLPGYEEVSYWQATGTDYSENGQLKVTTSSGHAVEVTGKILGVMYDRDALGVYNYDKRVPTHENKHAEFWNLWYKMDVSLFNDLNENCVVFFIQ